MTVSVGGALPSIWQQPVYQLRMLDVGQPPQPKETKTNITHHSLECLDNQMIVYQSQCTHFCLIKLYCRKDPIALQEGKAVYIQQFILTRNGPRGEEIQVLVPHARTVSAMTASCKFYRRPLSGNSLQELMFLQKEGNVLKAALWPQQRVLLCLQIKTPEHLICQNQCRVSAWIQIILSKTHMHYPAQQEEGYRELQAGQIHSSLQENYDANLPGSHFQTHEEQEGSSKQMIPSKQHGFTKDKLCLTNLFSFCDEMVGSVDMGIAVDVE